MRLLSDEQINHVVDTVSLNDPLLQRDAARSRLLTILKGEAKKDWFEVRRGNIVFAKGIENKLDFIISLIKKKVEEKGSSTNFWFFNIKRELLNETYSIKELEKKTPPGSVKSFLKKCGVTSYTISGARMIERNEDAEVLIGRCFKEIGVGVMAFRSKNGKLACYQLLKNSGKWSLIHETARRSLIIYDKLSDDNFTRFYDSKGKVAGVFVGPSGVIKVDDKNLIMKKYSSIHWRCAPNFDFNNFKIIEMGHYKGEVEKSAVSEGI